MTDVELSDQLRRVLRSLFETPGSLGRTAQGGVEAPLILSTPISQASPDCRGSGDWTERWTENIHHYTRGQLFAKVDSAPPLVDQGGGPVVSYFAECRFVGWVGSQRHVILTGAANTNTPPLRAILPGDLAFTRIALEVRQMTNGAPDFRGPTDIPEAILQLQVVGRIYR